MEYGFVKDIRLLDENHEVDDLFDSYESIERFDQSLRAITAPALIGYIGPYGTGKSTLLHNVRQKYPKEDAFWIQFNAWRYPDRKDLWEGFVLDFADQIGDSKEDLAKRIDGSPEKGTEAIGKVIEKFSGLKLYSSSPIKRVYEFEKILLSMITSCERDIYVVVEDIDRSDDQGVHFLQTLSHFLKRYKDAFDHEVRVIVPISDQKYLERKDDYIKCLDVTVNHTDSIKSFENFLTGILKPEYCISEEMVRVGSSSQAIKGSKAINKVATLLYEFLRNNPDSNIRELKHILRSANSSYVKLQEYNPDWRVVIAVAIIRSSRDLERQVLLERNLSSQVSTYIEAYLFSLYTGSSMYEHERERQGYRTNPDYPFLLVHRLDNNEKAYPSSPYAPDTYGNEKSFRICDFYFL